MASEGVVSQYSDQGYLGPLIFPLDDVHGKKYPSFAALSHIQPDFVSPGWQVDSNGYQGYQAPRVNRVLRHALDSALHFLFFLSFSSFKILFFHLRGRQRQREHKGEGEAGSGLSWEPDMGTWSQDPEIHNLSQRQTSHQLSPPGPPFPSLSFPKMLSTRELCLASSWIYLFIYFINFFITNVFRHDLHTYTEFLSIHFKFLFLLWHTRQEAILMIHIMNLLKAKQ